MHWFLKVYKAAVGLAIFLKEKRLKFIAARHYFVCTVHPFHADKLFLQQSVTKKAETGSQMTVGKITLRYPVNFHSFKCSPQGIFVCFVCVSQSAIISCF